MEKAMLVLCDGMRPDSIEACKNRFAQQFAAQSLASMQGDAIMPSITLPCIMSLFTSAMPQNHGIFTLQYAVPLTPVQGLFEQAVAQDAKCAMFYTWEELRDLARPGSLSFSVCISEMHAPCAQCDAKAVDLAINLTRENAYDFVFVYLGDPDVCGHKYGWLSEEYNAAVSRCWQSIEKLTEAFGDTYHIVVTADHGGHDHMHGTSLPQDMTIPLFIRQKTGCSTGKLPPFSILDIAPTIAQLMHIQPAPLWQGKALL